MATSWQLVSPSQGPQAGSLWPRKAFVEETMPFSLGQLQQVIRDTYDVKDRRRGVEGTFMWFMEEVGELAAALRGGGPQEELAAEFADVLAWLATLANIADVDLEAAVRAKYAGGCPGCGQTPCQCGAGEKP